MSDSKVVIQLVSESDKDPKTTIIKVKSIRYFSSEVTYYFDEDDQPSSYHAELFKLPNIKSAVKSINRRGRSRNIILTLSPELKKLYIDVDGNFVFREYYLEENISPPILSTQNIQENPPKFDLKSIANNIIIDNFENKNQNAKSWMKIFKSECQRLNVPSERYFEVLRLRLSGSPLLWYENLFKESVINWESYESSFVDTFGESSWSDVSYAYSYRWINGSYLDFALRKRSLLIDVDPSLSVQSQINFIVVGLPKYLSSHINKNEISSIDKLMSELRRFKSNDKRAREYNPGSKYNTKNKHERQINYSPVQSEN